MARRVALQFLTGSQEDARRFVEEYVLDAVDRVPETDACDSFVFVPGQPTTGDRTEGFQSPPPDHPVYLTIRGDVDAVVEAERDRWDSFVEDGVVTEWDVMKSTDRSEVRERLGEERAALLARQSLLSAEMAKLAYEAYDELGTVPAAVETFPDEEGGAAPFGWWAVLHTVTVQLNYSLDEELDVYRYGIEHALRNVAERDEGDGSDVDERLDDLIRELEAIREDVKDGRLDS